MIKKRWVPVVSMALFLLISKGLDYAEFAVERYRFSTFNTGYSWLELLVEVIFGAMMTFLAWLILRRNEVSFYLGGIFLAAALLSLLYILVSSLPALAETSNLGLIFLTAKSFFGRAIIMVFILGIVSLIPRKAALTAV